VSPPPPLSTLHPPSCLAVLVFVALLVFSEKNTHTHSHTHTRTHTHTLHAELTLFSVCSQLILSSTQELHLKPEPKAICSTLSPGLTWRPLYSGSTHL
jgi:hypothetical protein